jgi:hypothetical protein
MKPFLIRIAAFLTILFLLLLSFQLFISFRIRNTSIRGIDNLEQTKDVNADLVFMGASRCWAHFDPRFFDSVFHLQSVNIGVEAHSEIAMMKLRLQNYLSGNKPPKFAIISFDPFVRVGRNDMTHKDAFARYVFFPSEKNLPILNNFKFNLLEKYVPLYAVFKYRILKDCLFLKDKDRLMYMKYAFGAHDEQWDTIAAPIDEAGKKLYFKENQILPITDSLRELSRFCSSLGIKIICIQTPMYKVMQDDKKFDEARAICKTLNIPFIVVCADSIKNDPGCFYNAYHLNLKGVAQMNRVLENNSELKDLLSVGLR